MVKRESDYRKIRAAALAVLLGLGTVIAGCGAPEKSMQENTEPENIESEVSEEAAGALEEGAEHTSGPQSGPAESQDPGEDPAEEAEGASEEGTEDPGEEVQMNSSYFVEAGGRIVFRKSRTESLEPTALWGEFLNLGMGGASSAMMAYDPQTGETEELFEDPGYGKLLAVEGGFFCKRKDPSYGDIAYWVAADGEGTIELGHAEPLGLSRTQGETFVTLRDQEPDRAGDLFIVSGMAEKARAVRGGPQSLEYCGMTGEYAVYMVCDSEAGSTYLYSLSARTGEAVCLGEMPVHKGEFTNPYLEAEQMLSDEEGIYLVGANYEGTGHFLSYSLAVSAVPGQENSLQLLQDSAERESGREGEGVLLRLHRTEPGKAEIVPDIQGRVSLSSVTYGDLVYNDSPFSAVRLIFDFIPETDYEEPDKTVLQAAEVIGDSVYVITADVTRSREDDIGWREAFALLGLNWYRVPLADESGNLAAEGDREAELLAETAGEGEASYHEVTLEEAAGSWKMTRYRSGGDQEMIPAEENGVHYELIIREDGTADYHPEVNGVESLGAENMEISGSQGGALVFGFEDSETGWNSFEITDVSGDVMQVLYIYHLGDGSVDVLEEEYRRQ